MTEHQKRLFFFAVFALVFYLVGASFVQSFVSYPTWKVVGPNEFKAYYEDVSVRIIRIMVSPGLLEIVLTVALFWLRPGAIPRWPVALALGLNLVRFASTAMIQIRVREQLSTVGLSTDTIPRMIQGDYLTQASSIARALLYLWMMSQVIGGCSRMPTSAAAELGPLGSTRQRKDDQWQSSPNQSQSFLAEGVSRWRAFPVTRARRPTLSTAS